PARVGGQPVVRRLLSFGRVPAGVATASVLADLLLQASAQAVFALLGAALLMQLVGIWPAGVELAAGLGIAAAALGGFYAVQRYCGARLLDRAPAAPAVRWPSAGSAGGLRLQEGLEAIWRNPRRVLITTAMHMVGWLIGTLEVLIAMSLMGHPVTVTEATIIESLTNAIRGAAFAI